MIDFVKSSRRPIVIFLMGPTASGKTALALALKQRLPIEIVSVDSLLIYRDMDIGTAKPVIEELKLAPHRLINIRDPSESYSVADFFYDAIFEISDIINNGNIPLLVGGTMLYFKLLLDGLSPVPPASCLVREQIKQEADIIGWEVLYKRLQEIDPVSAAKIHLNDKRRLIRALEIFLISGKTLTELTKVSLKPLSNYQVCQFAILPNNCGVLDKRIVSRFYHMLDIGFESEVRSLYARRDLHDTMSSICSVGYRQMWSYLSGTMSYDDMIFNTICATRHLAKRQITWLRGWGHCINWLGNVTIFSNIDKIMQIISPILH